MKEVKKVIPEYFKEHLQEKIDIYNGLNACGFLYETDFHTKYNSMLSPLISKELADKTNINHFLVGGDFPYAFGTREECIADTVDAIEALKTVKDKVKLFIVKGNHDITIKTTKDSGYTASYEMTQKLLTEANSEGAMVYEDRMYYYVDDEKNKIRYICTDTCDAPQKSEDDYWGVEYGFSDTQAKWLCDIALNVPGDDWYVIATGHVPCVKGIIGFEEVLSPLAEILKDYRNKRKGKYADFTNYKGNFVAYICGHNHKDLSDVEDNTLFVSTGTSPIFNDDIWKREEGNITEILLDIFAVNKEKRKLYAVRIGAGKDREFDF